MWLCELEVPVDSLGSEHTHGKGEVKEVILTQGLIPGVKSGTFAS